MPAQRTGVQLRALEGGRRPADKLVSCNALLGSCEDHVQISATDGNGADNNIPRPAHQSPDAIQPRAQQARQYANPFDLGVAKMRPWPSQAAQSTA